MHPTSKIRGARDCGLARRGHPDRGIAIIRGLPAHPGSGLRCSVILHQIQEILHRLLGCLSQMQRSPSYKRHRAPITLITLTFASKTCGGCGLSIQVEWRGTTECRKRVTIEAKVRLPSRVFLFGVRLAAGVPIVPPSAGMSSVPGCRTMRLRWTRECVPDHDHSEQTQQTEEAHRSRERRLPLAAR